MRCDVRIKSQKDDCDAAAAAAAASAAAAAEAEYVLKKAENHILLSVSELGPSAFGKDPKRKVNI